MIDIVREIEAVQREVGSGRSRPAKAASVRLPPRRTTRPSTTSGTR